MSELSKLIDEAMQEAVSNVRVATTGEISRIGGGTADVNAPGMPPLINMRYVTGTYNVGDEVVIVFLGGNLSNGVIVGVL